MFRFRRKTANTKSPLGESPTSFRVLAATGADAIADIHLAPYLAFTKERFPNTLGWRRQRDCRDQHTRPTLHDVRELQLRS